MSRRIPLYFLVDNSKATNGDILSIVILLLTDILKLSKYDPWLLESLEISILEFGSSEPIVSHNIESIIDYNLQIIEPTNDKRYLGKALKLLKETIKRDLIEPTSEFKGDLRPIVAIFLFGESVDDFINEFNDLNSINRKPIGIYLFGSNKDLLKKYKSISSNTFFINSVKPNEILKLLNLNLGIEEPICSKSIESFNRDLILPNHPNDLNLLP